MFSHLSELVVRTADLLESEGRLLRRQLPALGMGAGLLVVASLMTVAGGVLLLAAVWLGISRGMGEPYGPAVASLVTGLLALGMAVGAFFGAAKLHR
jgi:hypothetical protein